MRNIKTYLHFMGNTEEAMNFYKTLLGGKFTIFQRFKDIPGGERMPENDQEKILHISLAISEDTTIMATDALESMGAKLVAGNNFHICLNVESEAEAERIFNGFSNGGKIEMPLNKTMWGSFFGMCRDKFEIQWMIEYVSDQNKS